MILRAPLEAGPPPALGRAQRRESRRRGGLDTGTTARRGFGWNSASILGEVTRGGFGDCYPVKSSSDVRGGGGGGTPLLWNNAAVRPVFSFSPETLKLRFPLQERIPSEIPPIQTGPAISD